MTELWQVGGSLLWTYLLHSTALLGSVALLDRLGWLQRWRIAEAAWRGALLGAWLTTAVALQLGGLHRAPEQASAAATLAVASPAVTHADTLGLNGAPAPSTAPPSPVAIEPVAVQKTPSLHAELAWLSPPVVALWTLGCGLAVLHLLLQVLRLAVRVRRLPAWPDADLVQRVERLAQQTGLAQPRLRCCARSDSPWAWLGTIALPAWAAHGLTPSQLSAVIAHELTHLRRQDPLWRLATELAARAGWLQPLNRLALRRLDELAEQACDLGAVQLIGTPQPLAQGLMRCAEQLQRGALHPFQPAPRLAHAMATRPAPLLARMRQLLENPTMSLIPNRTARWALVASLGLAAVALPAAILKQDDSRVIDWLAEAVPENLVRYTGSFQFSGSGKNILVKSGSAGQSTEMRWRDKLQVNEEQTDVLAASGPIYFRETIGSERREWQLTPQADGSLKRVFKLNGQEAPEDRVWLAKMLRAAVEATQPPLERAKQRFAKGGTAALLADMDATTSAYQTRQRIEASVETVPEAQSDSAWIQQLLERARRMDGDFERRHVLQRIAKMPQMQDADWVLLLKATATMDSDFERSEVLGSVAYGLPSSPAVQAAWLEAQRASGSAFERRRSLEALLRNAKGDWRATALASLQGMDSDFERRQSLSDVAERLQAGDTQLMQDYLKAASHLDSDFEHRQALQALLARKPSDAAVLRELMVNGAKMDSGFERLQVLQALAPLLPRDGSLDGDYRAVARSLSTHERGQAEQALDR